MKPQVGLKPTSLHFQLHCYKLSYEGAGPNHTMSYMWVWMSLVASLPRPNRDGWFLNKGPCPVYCSGHGRHYVGNDVVDESH